MTISAKIIADSISDKLVRIVSVELYYPRFIHAELMTHRVFSRNSSSSRAIPILKLIRSVMKDMALPVHWGKNQPGMQANEELTGWRLNVVKFLWKTAGYAACLFALLLYYAGVHKQIANRVIEPWSHITVLVTSTHWANFLALRNHPDAQPEIKVLASLIQSALTASKPKKLANDEWHLPYILPNEEELALDSRIKISVSRSASVSYKTVDGKVMSTDRAVALYDKLLSSAPLHASPAEHQAKPDWQVNGDWGNPKLHGNLTGWIQYRKTLKNEYFPDSWE